MVRVVPALSGWRLVIYFPGDGEEYLGNEVPLVEVLRFSSVPPFGDILEVPTCLCVA